MGRRRRIHKCGKQVHGATTLFGAGSHPSLVSLALHIATQLDRDHKSSVWQEFSLLSSPPRPEQDLFLLDLSLPNFGVYAQFHDNDLEIAD